MATQARVDPALAGMSTTFSALIVSRRMAYVVHVGDSRIYRLGDAGLELLTNDHVAGSGDFSHALRRAIGFEDTVHFDHATLGLSVHDRFLLCTDGVHGFLRHSQLRELLGKRLSPKETARDVVAAALDAGGGSDNATALIVDILDLPLADESEISRAVANLPIEELPEPGAVVDEFRLDAILSDGRYSRLMHATDLQNGKSAVLKFPHPRVAEEASYRLAFINETWVAARVRSPWIGEIIEIPPGRQTCLYSVMPFYEGETRETRLRRSPKLGLEEGVRIATRLARAVTTLHRAGIIHRDIKPENVILLNDGGLRLVDLGVCRAPHLEDFPEQDIPGTPSYVAPELFAGAAGDELSDQYALGVTVY
ncbi:MAG: protein kinase domain-containing protein, partial [Methylocella sp.]